MERNGLTAQIAAFAADAANNAIPAEAIDAAKRAFIDTVGVILAGRRESPVEIFASLLPDGDQSFALPGERRLSAKDAAMLNGMVGHVLDYDDVAQAGHPSVVLVPAILAEGQRLGVDGPSALSAYVVGFEAWAELARREPDAYHLGSWHPTAVLGTIAATAALVALHRLDKAKAGDAIAIAASMASGVIANFGTPMKPLQAGRAAAHAIEAVHLAKAGLSGAPDALEADHGLLRGISAKGNVDTASPTILPPAIWRLVSDGLSVKRYPVCYASHRAIDGVIALVRDHALAAEQVRKVTVTLGRAPAETLRYDNPSDGLEARFSMQHNVAAALVDGAVGFAQLTDEFVRRSDVAALYPVTAMKVVEDDPCPDQPGMAKFDRVEIETSDGRHLDSGPIRYAKGNARQRLSDEELAAKFLDCARHGGCSEPEALLGRLNALNEANDLRGLFA